MTDEGERKKFVPLTTETNGFMCKVKAESEATINLYGTDTTSANIEISIKSKNYKSYVKVVVGARVEMKEIHRQLLNNNQYLELWIKWSNEVD